MKFDKILVFTCTLLSITPISLLAQQEFNIADEVNLSCDAAIVLNESPESSSSALAAPGIRLCEDVEGSVTLPGQQGSTIKSVPYDADDMDAAIAAIDKLRRSLGIAGCKTPQDGCDCVFWSGKCKPLDFDETSGSEAEVEMVEDPNTGLTTIEITSNSNDAELEYELTCGCVPSGSQH